MTQASEADKATKIAWKRADIADDGISIDQHPEWATLQGERLVYQRFSNEGTVSVRWGDDATIADVLAHVGLESGAKRTIGLGWQCHPDSRAPGIERPAELACIRPERSRLVWRSPGEQAKIPR